MNRVVCRSIGSCTCRSRTNERRSSRTLRKALEVKRNSCPRPRGAACFVTPFLRGHASSGEGNTSATQPAIGGRRAAPNTQADSGGLAPRDRAYPCCEPIGKEKPAREALFSCHEAGESSKL